MRKTIAKQVICGLLSACMVWGAAPLQLAAADKVYVQPELPEIEGLVIAPDDRLPKLTARSAVVMEATTGMILYERDMDARRFPASTTKMMTLIVALEEGDLDDMVTVSERAAGLEGSTLWLEPGDRIKLRELLMGMMMHSGNDATVAVAEHIAGSVPKFVKLMNKKAHELGADDTNFVNANGLPDDNHYTTAHDLARIAAYGYSLPEFESFVSQQEVQYDWVKDPTHQLRNENQMLWLYRGANGVKTGYTEKAGRCLVSAARRDGLQLVAVVLDSVYMWNDSIALLDLGFASVEPVQLAHEGEVVGTVEVDSAREDEIKVVAAHDFAVPRKRGEHPKIEKKLYVPDSIEAPVKKGDVVGKLVCYYDGQKMGGVDVLAAQDVERSTWFMRFKLWLKSLFKGIF